MKKIVALILALVICLSLAVPAFAIPARPPEAEIENYLAQAWAAVLLRYSDFYPGYDGSTDTPGISADETPAPTPTLFSGEGLIASNAAVQAAPVLLAQAMNVHSGETYMHPGESYDLFWFDQTMVQPDRYVDFYPDVTNPLPFPASPFDTSEYRLVADWEVGGAMVSKVYIDDYDDAHPLTGSIVIDLMENFTIDDLKDLKGTITLEAKDSANSDWVFGLDGHVSNDLEVVDGYSKIADSQDDAIDTQNNTIYWCEDEPGYVTFNKGGRLLSATLKMVKDEKAFMYNDESMIDAVEEMYGNMDADIECYQFGGAPVFQNDAMFSLQADYADQYFVYEWDGTSLTKVDYEWDSINGVYMWSTKAPIDYVISDKELVAAATDEVEKNPDTGANHIGAAAGAIVVLSLVSAAVVSFKKK